MKEQFERQDDKLDPEAANPEIGVGCSSPTYCTLSSLSHFGFLILLAIFQPLSLRLLSCVAAMPPLPLNGSSYPPSTSAYQPLLNADDQDDIEASHSSSRRVSRRTFSSSPYRARANDPTDLLQTFLSDTRSTDAAGTSKRLYLRITVGEGRKKIELPLPVMTMQDSLPFALADDVPCLRGLPGSGACGWKEKLSALVHELTGSSSSTSHPGKASALQVWNASHSKPLYATPEEIDRYHTRLRNSDLHPWTPLNTTTTSATQPPSTHTANPDEEVDKLFTASGSQSDFDLSSVFSRSRPRKATRLVSSALQEAFERFADDRHFSKWLVCRNVVWGWHLERLRRKVEELVKEVEVDRKGKGKSVDVGAEERVEVKVIGLDDERVYHVVWSPIVFLTSRAPRMFDSRISLLALMGSGTAFVVAVVLGMLSNTLLIIVVLLALCSWSTLTWLVRTQQSCVYDTVGTAWSLAPRWVKVPDVDPAWDRERVVETLKVDAGSGGPVGKVERRGPNGDWFVQRGMDPEEWLQSYRERLMQWVRE
ncbi:alpha-1,2-mannosidase [Pseudozyma hubeiensis SY62]|uniref:Alpha-1,2-mannosidase n=1 Tax=Pseudozyma hubeiensis (strain SY62) TaxID=1305764 RepID=R9P416_PSEHS|nr:alpha-1,2-mannosidase [Pseudozyma hubeiensis SY62]GAC96106.1 alpha-1,2-mannosidase [Pseudozyma hubeiensis SY62]